MNITDKQTALRLLTARLSALNYGENIFRVTIEDLASVIMSTVKNAASVTDEMLESILETATDYLNAAETRDIMESAVSDVAAGELQAIARCAREISDILGIDYSADDLQDDIRSEGGDPATFRNYDYLVEHVSAYWREFEGTPDADYRDALTAAIGDALADESEDG